MAQRRAVILRGVPGSGKSTRAAQLAREAGLAPRDCVFNADAVAEELVAQGETLPFRPRCHQIVLTRFIAAAAQGVPLLVSDNTNIENWEFMAYEAAARAMGYAVEQQVVGEPCNPDAVEAYANRNQHAVPADVVRDMARRLCASLAQGGE